MSLFEKRGGKGEGEKGKGGKGKGKRERRKEKRMKGKGKGKERKKAFNLQRELSFSSPKENEDAQLMKACVSFISPPLLYFPTVTTSYNAVHNYSI